MDRAARTLPPHEVLLAEPGLLDSAAQRVAAAFSDVAVIQTAQTLQRFHEDVLVGLDLADGEAVARIGQRWTLSEAPEDGQPFTRPALILTGRQDSGVGYADQFTLLPHYPRATFAVVDMAGHNLQFEQPELFEALMADWLNRTAEHR